MHAVLVRGTVLINKYTTFGPKVVSVLLYLEVKGSRDESVEIYQLKK